MNDYLPLLRSTTLFTGIETEPLRVLISELGAAMHSFGKDETLVTFGKPNRQVGIVLSGVLEAYRPAPRGARIPMARLGPGEVFGDALSSCGGISPVTVTAAAPSEVLLLPYDKLLAPSDDPYRQLVARNMVRAVSDKYFELAHRVELLMITPLRAKVCAYLLGEAERAGSATFTIPYSRMQLSEYLNCDRSALSRELSLMQREGLLDTYRSSFKLLDVAGLRKIVQ